MDKGILKNFYDTSGITPMDARKMALKKKLKKLKETNKLQAKAIEDRSK